MASGIPFFLRSLRPAACAGVLEVFAVAGRGEALGGSELAGEVGGVGKAAFGGDVAHRKVGLDEELAGLADPQLRDVLADRHARAALEDALELAVRQVGDGRERGEAQGAVVVGVEEGEDALHPLPVARVFAEGDFAGGERAAAAAGKVDEDRLQFQHLPRRGKGAECQQARAQPPGGAVGEFEAAAGLRRKPRKRRIFRHQRRQALDPCLREPADDGAVQPVLADKRLGLPGMRQVRAEQHEVAVAVALDMVADEAHAAAAHRQRQLELRVIVPVEGKGRQLPVEQQPGPVRGNGDGFKPGLHWCIDPCRA